MGPQKGGQATLYILSFCLFWRNNLLQIGTLDSALGPRAIFLVELPLNIKIVEILIKMKKQFSLHFC